jgi:hypothetical protein
MINHKYVFPLSPGDDDSLSTTIFAVVLFADNTNLFTNKTLPEYSSEETMGMWPITSIIYSIHSNVVLPAPATCSKNDSRHDEISLIFSS